ncbi:MAG: T9SS type A sorting domain-containing protein [Cyclobacteriaceae bacterium]
MKQLKFVLPSLSLFIYSFSYSQCPSAANLNNTDVTITSPNSCSLTGGTITQGYALGENVLIINDGAIFTINGDFEVYDRIEIYGEVIVNGNMFVASAAGDASTMYLEEGGSLTVNGNYTNGEEDFLVFAGDEGVSDVNGDMVVTGTYTNNDGGTTNVGDNATMQFGEYEDNGGTLNTPEGQDNCENGECCGGGCASLPIQLLSFSATERDGNALIEWKTGSEIDNDYFEIQKATFSNPAFTTIGTIEGNGTTTDIQHYSFVDEGFHEDSYYRLVQFDFDGRNETFKMKTLIKLLWSNEQDDIHIYPNPSSGNITISGVPFTGYQIFDHTGKLIWTESQTIPQVAQQNINEVLKNRKGTFFLIFNDEKQVFNKRLIKQ